MIRIIFVGYMCVGKTTLGNALARELGCFFYDLDWYIEDRYHKSVSEIFAERGEAGFRELEQRMLHEVAEFENVVISCGGGTPIYRDNMDYLNAQGETIYLEANADTILAHIAMSRTERPLLKGKSQSELKSYVEEQLALRHPHYNKAKHVVHINIIDGFDKVSKIVQDIKSKLNL